MDTQQTLERVKQLRQGSDADLEEAIALLRSLLDEEIPKEERLEALYLLGISLDNLSREQEAIPVYIEYLNAADCPKREEVLLYLASSHLNEFQRIFAVLEASGPHEFDEVHTTILERLKRMRDLVN